VEDIRKALAVSIGSRGFAALLGLVALPLYLQFLGVEAYGVIGLFASLQVLVAFMDLGLGLTLTRELAAVGRARHELERGRVVAISFELAYLGLAALIAGMFAAAAPVVALRWVNLEALTAQEVSLSLQLGGVSLACQWPANLYAAGLAGLHRQTALAVSSSALACVRIALGLSALWFVPTLESFFTAQVAASLLQSAVLRVQLWRALALPGHRPKPAMEVLRQSRGFAGSMMIITITSIVLTQMDKLILSHLLQLPDFGVYAVASSLASGLYILITPVFLVVYPRLSAAWSSGDLGELSRLYHASSQFMAMVVLPLALVMVWFPSQSLFVLTGNQALSDQGAAILAFLAMGSALNGLMNMPYALQLASGWTALTIRTNLLAVAVLAPLTWWFAARYGAVGGSFAWLALNLGYFLLTPLLMHQRLLAGEKLRWYAEGIFLAAGPCVLVVALAWVLHQPVASRAGTCAQLALYWLLATAVTLACLPRVRGQARALLAAYR
jgi:O-antigen/teichoic acid export membrane protein